MIVFFGDPESKGVKQDARQCARMALAMQRRMAELKETWRNAGIDRPLRCRMGINTGFCTVGNFGSENRMDYTIIGSGVNLASRLESAANPGEILISYETFALIREEFQCEEHGEIEARGFAYPVTTYVLVDDRAAAEQEESVTFEARSNFNLHIDLKRMSSEERDAASRFLRNALDRLSSGQN